MVNDASCGARLTGREDLKARMRGTLGKFTNLLMPVSPSAKWRYYWYLLHRL